MTSAAGVVGAVRVTVTIQHSSSLQYTILDLYRRRLIRVYTAFALNTGTSIKGNKTKNTTDTPLNCIKELSKVMR